MAARGSILKSEITKKILEVFPNSFLYNDGKEVRINGSEEGNPIQIKVTLTAAKTAVDADESPFPTAPTATSSTAPVTSVSNEKVPQEPTQEEKDRLAALLAQLGL